MYDGSLAAPLLVLFALGGVLLLGALGYLFWPKRS
jgi:hypothetical protein